MSYSEQTKYLTMTKKSFCEVAEIDGEYVDKFARQMQMRISDWMILCLKDDGFDGTKRKKEAQIPPDEYPERLYRCART